MTPERKRKMLLAAKDYPIRIKTCEGKFLLSVVTFQKDEYGMPINQRLTYAQFDSLADAIECGIRWREARYAA